MQRRLGTSPQFKEEVHDFSDQDFRSEPKPFKSFSFYNFTHRIQLKDTQLHILDKFEQNNLKECFKGAMLFRFDSTCLQVSYNEEDLLEEVYSFIDKIAYVFFSAEQLHGRAAMLQCKSLKSELHSKGFHLFSFKSMVFLYGRNRWKHEIDEIKTAILGQYIHEVKFFHYKKSLNLEEKLIFEAICQKSNNFQALTSANPSKIVSIEPKVSRPEQRNRWGLSFITRSRRKVEFKSLCRTIYQSIKQYGHIGLITSKPRLSNFLPISPKYTLKHHMSRSSLQNYIFIIYERNKTDPSQLEEFIRELEVKTECRVEGLRFLESQLEMSLTTAKFELQQLGCRTQFWPKDCPFAINAYIKSKYTNSTNTLRSLLRIAHERSSAMNNQDPSEGSEEDENISCIYSGESSSSSESEPQEQEQKDSLQKEEAEEQVCKFEPQELVEVSPQRSQTKNESADMSNSEENFQISKENQPQQFVKQQNGQKEDNLLFTLSSSKPIDMVINGKTFRRTIIECSLELSEAYNSVVEKESAIGIKGINLKQGNLEMFKNHKDLTVISLEAAYQLGESFVEGYYKPQAFAGEHKCLAVRPCFLMELKPPSKKKGKKKV